jgi:hypothetical protein
MGPKSCSYDFKMNCVINNSFYAFTSCSDVTICSASCCVISGLGYNDLTEEDCGSRGGQLYRSSCNSIDLSGSFGSLSGYVKERGTNRALANVDVYVGSYKAVTDGNGYYRFDQVPTSNPNKVSIKAYFSFYQQFDSVQAMVSKGQETTAPVVYMVNDLNSQITIKGNVKDSADVVLSGVVILLSSDYYSSTSTDSAGNFILISQLTAGAGSYTLKAVKPGYNSATKVLSITPGNIYINNDFVLTKSSVSTECGNGVRNIGEECDPPDDTACPGRCLESSCTCPLSCTEQGNFCADKDYQCTNVGRIISSLNDDCDTSFNNNQGVCCDTTPTVLPECIYGETQGFPSINYTNVGNSGGTYCKCGSYIANAKGTTLLYCCVNNGVRNLSSTVCSPSGSVFGLVSAEGAALDGVSVQISSIYQTTSNTSTDVNYNFPAVVPGSYTLTATKFGYNDYSVSIQVVSGQSYTKNIPMTRKSGMNASLTLSASAIKGYPYAKLTWTMADRSSVSYFVIKRSDGLESAHINSTVSEYIDTMTEWDKGYTYNITAYALNAAVIDADSTPFTSGNEACEGVLDTNQFCVSSNCFALMTKAACGLNDTGTPRYRIVCDSSNKYQYATGSATGSDPSDCGSSEACVDTGSSTTCSGVDACETLGMPPSYTTYTGDLANIFGLFYGGAYTVETCTKTSGNAYKYCYKDYFYSNVLSRRTGSYTEVDQCLSCNPTGFCYDYQSKAACQNDSCNYGNVHGTKCGWKDTFGEIGKGICYSNDTESTKYCAMCDVATHPAYYNFNCTQDICNLLGTCIASTDRKICNKCDLTSTCSLFDNMSSACLGNSQGYAFKGQPQIAGQTCNSSTIINYSDDTCGIGFCRYTAAGKCIKDANYDNVTDCYNSTGDVSCDQDRSVPSSSLSPQTQTYISLSKTTIKFTTSGSNVKLYYCFSDVGSYCCPTNLVTSNLITLPNAENNFVGLEKKKVLWYYAASAYGNPEPINNVTIDVDTKPPRITISHVRVNSTLGYDLSDLTFTITSDEVALSCTDYLSGSGSVSRITSTALTDKVEAVTYPGLQDGSYIYHVECSDSYGNKNASVYYNVEVDRNRLIENAQPNFKTLAYSNINFSMETMMKQYYCFFKQTSPTSGFDTAYGQITTSANRYYYVSPNNELYNSNTYLYSINCYEDSAKTKFVDRASIIFTVDKQAPISSFYVYGQSGWASVIPNKYYTTPKFKLNCSDPVQGPPREFGCNKMKYCYGLSSCSPSVGTTVSNASIEITPALTESGLYYFCYQSSDSGNNTETAKCTSVNIDLAPPRVTIETPPNLNVIGDPNFVFSGKWFDQLTPTMQAKIQSNRTVIMIDSLYVSGDSSQGTYSGTAILNDLCAGLNTLTVIGIDASGNTGQASVNFYYDLYPPTISRTDIYGEDAQRGAVYVVGGETTISAPSVLSFQKITDNGAVQRHHEYGNRVKTSITANDYSYLDQTNSWGTDVNGTVTIYPQDGSNSSWSNNISYNSSSKAYENIFSDLFEIGNYTVVFDISDNLGNPTSASTTFYVNDTVGPYFSIKIYDYNGNNVSSVQYGVYDVVITPSEPIYKLHYLNFTVKGKTKYVTLTSINGTNLTGTLSISTSDLDLRELSNEKASFAVYGEDMHNKTGNSIAYGKDFYITTAGPMQPVILTPLVGQNITFVSFSKNYTIEGIVYADAQSNGLRNGDVSIYRNNIIGDYTDGNWVISGQTVTTTNSFNYSWDYARFQDKITYRNNNTINLNDYNIFLPGRYMGFQNHPLPNKKLYKIISRTAAGVNGVKQMYDISLDRDLVGFTGMVPGSQFEDNIKVWELDAPDGWFNFSVNLAEGHNYFYAAAKSGANPGLYSTIFDIIYDSTPPTIINVSPMNGTKTGEVNAQVYAYVNPTGSNITSRTMTINGVPVNTTLQNDNQGYVKIAYAYTGVLDNKIYNVALNATDSGGNKLYYTWQFEIDSTMPMTPVIRPAGTINYVTPAISVKFVEPVISLDEVMLTSATGTSYSINLTNKMSYNGNNYSYQLLSSEQLVQDGNYTVKVKAKKAVGTGYGNQGLFLQTFALDRMAPDIIYITNPVHYPTPPAYIFLKTNELATCRYGYYDLPYDQLPYTPAVPVSNLFAIDHTILLYDMTSLQTSVYVSCMDQAGNKMTTSKRVNVTLDSLLYPPPKIYLPPVTYKATMDGSYNIVGSTFNATEPLLWVPNVNVILGRSEYFYTKEVQFDNKYYTQSLDKGQITGVSDASFALSLADNAIIISDSQGLFVSGAYVDFTKNRKQDYTLYQVKSAMRLSDPVDPYKTMVTFEDSLPSNLTSPQSLYIYAQKSPAGWFEYALSLAEGNNFFYAAGSNTYGEGQKTSIYNIVKDTTVPSISEEFPHDGEVVSEESLDVYALVDGTYTNITRNEFKLDNLPRTAQISFVKDFESKIKYSTTQTNSLHTAYVKAYDANDNSAEKTWSFTIDARAPTRPTITPNTFINNTLPLISIQFTQQVNVQSAKLVGDSYNKDMKPGLQNSNDQLFTFQTQDRLSEGKYKILVNASKKNPASTATGYWYEYFTVDLTAPSITSYPPYVITSKIPVEFIMLTNEDTKCKYSEEDKSYDNMENTLDTIYQKNHYVSAYIKSSITVMYVRCKDKAGNAMSSSVKIPINNGIPCQSVCGDGAITCTEECDGLNVGTMTSCGLYNSGFKGGSIKCDPLSCRFDTSNCYVCMTNAECTGGKICVNGSCVPSHCSDGVKNNDETAVDCGGADCAVCPTCGNNKVELGETCDGTDFGKVTDCKSLNSGFAFGPVTCKTNMCHFDTSQCVKASASCGNNMLDVGEQCDGNLGNASCSTFGLGGGNLQCTGCKYNTSSCQGTAGTCGNNAINPGEECDSMTFKVIECNQLNPNFASGTMGCNTCQLTTASCVPKSACQDGIVNPGEECDSSLGNATCSKFDNFVGGTLSCTNSCWFNTSKCVAITHGCGDGRLDAGEQCDKGSSSTIYCNRFDSYVYGTVTCDQQCRYDLSTCCKDQSCMPVPVGCGNGVLDSSIGEQCEQNIILTSCRSLGFNSDNYPSCYSAGTANQCKYDTTNCGGSCQEGQTLACNQTNPIYVAGSSVCRSGLFDVSCCYSPNDVPRVDNHNVPQSTSSQTITINGNVSKAKRLEIYVEGTLVSSINYTCYSTQQFTFPDVYLPKTTATSDGLNHIKFYTYGAIPNIVNSYEAVVTVSTSGANINIVKPLNRRANVAMPYIEINTTRSSTCKITYLSGSTSYDQNFATSNRFVHSLTLQHPLSINTNNAVTISCTDDVGVVSTFATTIFVDTINPKVNDVKIQGRYQLMIVNQSNYKSVILFSALNESLRAEADSAVKCKFGLSNDYSSMSYYDNTQSLYMNVWITLQKQVSTTTQVTYYTICEDEAGLLSNPYQFDITIDPNYPITITNNNSQYVKDVQPVLRFSTKRSANCDVIYNGDKRTASKSETENSINYEINVNTYNLRMVDGNTYYFDIECKATDNQNFKETLRINVTADLIAPRISILSPKNNQVFNSDEVNVEVSTEAMSTVQLSVDNVPQTSNYTISGILPLKARYLKIGQNLISATATDKAGNTNTTSIYVYSTVNPTAPYINRTYPEEGQTVQRVWKLYAYVWTVYGAQLSLNKSKMVLTKDSDGQPISGGQAAFTPGTPGSSLSEIGNYTYTFINYLADGNYTWNISVTDEFSKSGLDKTVHFTVNQALPVISLTSPFAISTNSASGIQVHYTNSSIVTITGKIESLSTLTEAYLRIDRNTGSGFGNPDNLNIVNGEFTKSITLDNIAQGSTKEYTIDITAKNIDGFQSDLLFKISLDRQASIASEVRIE